MNIRAVHEYNARCMTRETHLHPPHSTQPRTLITPTTPCVALMAHQAPHQSPQEPTVLVTTMRPNLTQNTPGAHAAYTLPSTPPLAFPLQPSIHMQHRSHTMAMGRGSLATWMHVLPEHDTTLLLASGDNADNCVALWDVHRGRYVYRCHRGCDVTQYIFAIYV